MKFGETFKEYLHGDQEWFLEKVSNVEYKRLKKVLRSCRSCKNLHASSTADQELFSDSCCNSINQKELCQCDSCPLCDQMFFNELMKEASDIAGCFRARVRRLMNLHISGGLWRYVVCLCRCFRGDQDQVMIQEGRMLIEYITMNAIAMRKILKKYDKIHSSANGKNFKSKMRAEHTELLQSPWLVELGSFHLNCRGLNAEDYREDSIHFSFDLDVDRPIMTMSLGDSINLEYDLTCAICLETVFNPYALSCGHLFCKSCACSAASVMISQGPKAATSDAKCPVCREAGVYINYVHMVELNLLLKRRCRKYWKDRMTDERAEMVKQSKDYWDLQGQLAVGF